MDEGGGGVGRFTLGTTLETIHTRECVKNERGGC